MSALLGAWHRTRRSVARDETTHGPSAASSGVRRQAAG